MRLPATLSVSSERPCRYHCPSGATEAQSPCTHTPGQRDQYVAQVAVGVVPDAARHRRPGAWCRRARPRSRRAPAGPSASQTSTAMPSAGPPSEHGSRRHGHVAGQQAGADLGAAGDVDDRPPPLADLGEQPAPGLRVPRLARGAEGAQAREVGGARVLGAVLLQRADQRRRDAAGTPRGGRRRSATAGPGRGSRAPRRRPPACRRAAWAPTVAHGPMIQPMSVAQCRASPSLQVGLEPGLLAILARKPAWTWTAPFGRPVVPEV